MSGTAGSAVLAAPGYEANTWFGIGAPRNTPADIVARLNREINAVLADPEIASWIADFGGTVATGSPADFGALIAGETEQLGEGDQSFWHDAELTEDSMQATSPSLPASRRGSGGVAHHVAPRARAEPIRRARSR